MALLKLKGEEEARRYRQRTSEIRGGIVFALDMTACAGDETLGPGRGGAPVLTKGAGAADLTPSPASPLGSTVPTAFVF